MACQRKIPFGYQIRDGLIQPHPQEAEMVRYIFGQYRAGASLLTIAEDMTRQGIRYHQHTAAWNKNMVKRILENPRYTGSGGWPRLVSNEDFAAVQCQREERNTYAPLAAELRPILGKAVCGLCGAKLIRGNRTHGRIYWHCQNPDCGQRAAISDGMLAGLVDRQLWELARSPELLTVPEARQFGPDLESIRLQNELTQAFNRGGESPEYVRSLILRIAAQRYDRLPDPTPAHDLNELRERLEAGQVDAGTLSELLATAVQAIRLGPNKSVALELINGTVIAEAEEENP